MKIGVIGSINVDLVVGLDKFVRKGETLIGNDIQLYMGGKGANQATMIKALSDSIIFCGAVGNDVYAEKVSTHFDSIGLSKDFIQHKMGSTGLAIIQLVEGDNAIVVVPGVNNSFSKQDVDHFLESNPEIHIMVLQLEINFDIVKYIIKKCKELDIKVILNPAPAAKLDQNVIDDVDYLIPNETETELIFGSNDYHDVVSTYKGKVLVTLGEKGVIFWDKHENVPKIVPANKIKVVDTTGAGDSFVAGFAVGLLNQLDLQSSIKLGIDVASMTCESMGAQSAIFKIKDKFKTKEIQ